MQRADGETIAHARNQQPHRQRGERVEPGEPGQITDNPGATTGEDAASERACQALAISSDEFSRGGRQHIAKQPLLDGQRHQRHPQRRAVHRRNSLRLREMARRGP